MDKFTGEEKANTPPTNSTGAAAPSAVPEMATTPEVGPKPAATPEVRPEPEARPEPAGNAHGQGIQNNAAGVAFKAEDIGRITAVKNDSFEDQNRKAAEKKEQRVKQRKIALIAGLVAIGIIILGLIIWLIVALATREPEDGLTNDERKTQQIHTGANDLYNNPDNAEGENDENAGDATATKDYFDNLKEESKNDDERLQVLLAELEFWSVKDRPDLAFQAAEEIGNFRDLDTDDAIRYCSAYTDAATALDNPDSVNTEECDQFLMEQEGEEGEYAEASEE